MDSAKTLLGLLITATLTLGGCASGSGLFARYDADPGSDPKGFAVAERCVRECELSYDDEDPVLEACVNACPGVRVSLGDDCPALTECVQRPIESDRPAGMARQYAERGE